MSKDAPRFTRRHLLAASALVAGGGALGLGLRVASHWQQDPSPPFRSLSASEGEIVDAIAEALFPPGGTPALSGRDVGAARWFDEVITHQPAPTGDLLRLVLHVLDDWSRVSEGAGFAALGLDRRTERLAAWTHHRRHEVRGVVSAVVLFISAAYCTHPEVRRAMGWQFPCGYEA